MHETTGSPSISTVHAPHSASSQPIFVPVSRSRSRRRVDRVSPAMAGTDLFTHIKYMTITTMPTYLIALTVFSILSINLSTNGNADMSSLLSAIDQTFNINPFLFIVPLLVVLLIILKTITVLLKKI